MESSMSSVSFDEDDFYTSSEDEVRYVDIEKEIMNKKLNDTFAQSPSSKYVTKRAEKENIHQKSSGISKSNSNTSLLGQRKVFTGSLGYSKSPAENAVAKTQSPVRHLAYRTPSAVCKASTPQDKVKYVATRTPTAVSDKDSFSEKYISYSHISKNTPSPHASGSSVIDNPIKSKAATDFRTSSIESELDDPGEPPDAEETAEIPNFDNIEIIDDESDDTASVSEENRNTQKNTAQTTRSESASTVPQNKSTAKKNKTHITEEVETLMEKVSAKPSTKPLAIRTPPVRSEDSNSFEAKNQTLGKVASSKVISKRVPPSKPSTSQDVMKSITQSNASSIAKMKSLLATGIVKTTSANNTMLMPSSSTTAGNRSMVPMNVAPTLTFIVPTDDISKCRNNNTPLVLSVPPLQVAGGPPITTQTKRNLLMILPQQLPSNLQGPGVVNFIVTNPYTKPSVAVQIPIVNSGTKQNPLSLLKKPDASLKNSNSFAVTKTTPAEKMKNNFPTDEVRILNTREKDGPKWCWYAPRFGKRDLEGFLYKDRLGFTKAETEKSKKCLRQLNYAIHEKQIELDSIAASIIRIKRNMKATQTNVRRFGASEEMISATTLIRPYASSRITSGSKMQDSQGYSKSRQSQKGKNKIKIVSVTSLSKDEDMPELEAQEPLPMDDQTDDGASSELYFTKKVVILRNKMPPGRKKTKRIGRLPKIKLRQSRAMNSNYQKQRMWKANLPSVRKCSVVLERNEQLEQTIKEKFDLKERSRRKRKIDLESMGLIKKIRRRNAIDTPPMEKLKISSNAETFDAHRLIQEKQDDVATSSSSGSPKLGREKSFDLSPGHQKSTHTDYRKSVFMSYREYQKILKLAHTEIKFIFALNTIHALDDFRLDETKPLLILDQFNYKVDFESTSNYNVVFTRDDDEALPAPIVKNLELVFLVRHGHIKVVSRPVLCKYLLEKCNLMNQPVEETQMMEQISDSRIQHVSKKSTYDVEETVSNRSDSKENFTRNLRLKRKYNKEEEEAENDEENVGIKVRKDLMHSGLSSMPSSISPQKLKKDEKAQGQRKEDKIPQSRKQEEKIIRSPRKEDKIFQSQKREDKSTLSQRKEDKSTPGQKREEKHTLGQRKEKAISGQKKGEKVSLGHRITRSSSHSTKVSGQKSERSDSLEIKFNEIEKNLSLMFEKTRPSRANVSKQLQSSDNLNENDDVIMKDLENKTSQVLHSRDTTPDLDHILTNSGDETNKATTVTEVNDDTLDDKTRKEKDSNDASQKSDTTKSLEKLLVSSPESDDVDSESAETRDSYQQLSKPVMIDDNIELFEGEDSLPATTRNVEENTAESTKSNCESTESKETSENAIFEVSEPNEDLNVEKETVLSDVQNDTVDESIKTHSQSLESVDSGLLKASSAVETVPVDKNLDEEISENTTRADIPEPVQDVNIEEHASPAEESVSMSSVVSSENIPQTSANELVTDYIATGEDIEGSKNDSENLDEEMVSKCEARAIEDISEDNLEASQRETIIKLENEGNLTSQHENVHSIMEERCTMIEESCGISSNKELVPKEEDDRHVDLNVDQFLASSSDNMETETDLNVDQFLEKDDTETILTRKCDSAKDSVEDIILKDSSEDTRLNMEVDNLPDTSNISDVDDIFKKTSMPEEAEVQSESDPIIPQTEQPMYLISERSANAESTCVDTSCETSMPTLQISSANIEDVEETSKMSYSETSFESSVVLNDQVTENIMNSSSEFDMFESQSDKVANDPASMPSSGLDFPDDENGPEPNMIGLDSKKSSDSENLLGSCEIDSDIALCSDEISKNLPDDYLEK